MKIQLDIDLDVVYEEQQITLDALKRTVAKYIAQNLISMELLVAVDEAKVDEFEDPYVNYNCYKITQIR